MRYGLAETDAWLEQWRRAEPVEVGGELELEAEKAAVEIEELYDKQRPADLIGSAGWKNQTTQA